MNDDSTGMFLRSGDRIAISVGKEFRVGVIETVWPSDKFDGYLKVLISGEKKHRHIHPDKVDEILISRKEDVSSPRILDLRYKESMLLSQIDLISSIDSGAVYLKSQGELVRTLRAVHDELIERRARPSLGTQRVIGPTGSDHG